MYLIDWVERDVMNDCHDRPCPDDDNYECYTCGNPTGNGYDSEQCATCLEED